MHAAAEPGAIHAAAMAQGAVVLGASDHATVDHGTMRAVIVAVRAAKARGASELVVIHAAALVKAALVASDHVARRAAAIRVTAAVLVRKLDRGAPDRAA